MRGISGEGVVGSDGETTILLDDDVVAATATLDLIGNLSVTLVDDALLAFAVSGRNGLFVRRPLLVLN